MIPLEDCLVLLHVRETAYDGITNSSAQSVYKEHLCVNAFCKDSNLSTCCSGIPGIVSNPEREDCHWLISISFHLANNELSGYTGYMNPAWGEGKSTCASSLHKGRERVNRCLVML